MGNYDFYLAASLNNGNYDLRNKAVEDVFKRLHKKIYRPTIDSNLSPKGILERNIEAINNSNGFLFFADDPGEGVFIELGYAYASNKPIYALGNDMNSYGKMFLGIVESLPKDRLFKTISELEKALRYE